MVVVVVGLVVRAFIGHVWIIPRLLTLWVLLPTVLGVVIILSIWILHVSITSLIALSSLSLTSLLSSLVGTVLLLLSAAIVIFLIR